MGQGNSNDVLLRAGETFGQQLADLFTTVRIKSMTVESVEEDFAYCKIYEEDEALPVSLSTLNIEGAYLKVYPAVDSTVVVGFINGNDVTPLIVAYSLVTRVEFKQNNTALSLNCDNSDNTLRVTVGGSSIELSEETITINGGSNKGMVLIDPLTNRLNKLQREVNALVQIYNSHTHPYTWTASAGAGVTTPSTSRATNVSEFSTSEYENEKVKQ